MSSKFKLLIIAIISFLLTQTMAAQQVKQVLENEKQLVYKINSYTDDSDKLLRKECSNDKEIKILYTCIQTGFVVFESKTNINSRLKDEIQLRIKKVIEAVEFLHMKGFGLKEAEEKCITTKN